MRPRPLALRCAFAAFAIACARPGAAFADGVTAGASRLAGRVLERGGAVPIAGATLTTRGGVTATTDGDGRFRLDLPPGSVEIAVGATGYEPFQLVETLAPGVARTVEYRLMPLPGRADRYRSTVRGNANHEGEHFTLRDEELRQAPGSLGDPFRVIASLPGVIQPIPLLPIYVVRGGSPAMNGFFVDGMRLPQLFHLVIADSVIHPRMLDRLDFYPGSYDATFGRYASGIVDSATRAGRTDAPFHGEVELKLYDASALIEARIPGGVSLIAAGRYGYPGPLIHLLAPGVNLDYWDYQIRLDWKGLTLEALGSYDSLRLGAPNFTSSPQVDAQLLTTFHRVQLRERARRGIAEFEAAIVGGIDRMSVLSGQGVQKLGLSARFETKIKLPVLTLQLGADGELSRFRAEQFGTDGAASAPDQLGDLGGDRDGVVAGAYAQGTLALDRWLGVPTAITAGVRADVYHAGPVTLLGIDPRILFRVEPQRWLEIFGGFGLYQQPPSFPVPLPGIDTYALQLGLQRNWQGSVGMRLKLPESFTASLTGYYGKFENINDVIIDYVASTCTSPPPESLTGVPAYVTRQVSGAGYGMEVLVRRTRGNWTGWVSYTLSRAERIYSCGLGPGDFDQAHVFNGVVQVRLPWRVMVGARVTYSTGRPYTQLNVDTGSQSVTGFRNNARLPNYAQLDLRVDREWIFRRWALAVFIEALNLTYSQSVFGITYPKTANPLDPSMMITRYDMPQVQGFNWILPSVGLRGRF